MRPWSLDDAGLKSYPHFDSYISAKDAEKLATDPDRVAKHTFYPFIRYVQRWTRFAEAGSFGKSKKRAIRYAARRDAYIFSYYRHMLAALYEEELQRLALSTNIIAYRHIQTAGGKSGKCNIHFAFDAFERIRAVGDCCVVALDISDFFESLDHSRIKQLWCRLLRCSKLPEDHFKVFAAITNYAVVDKIKAYERLGHFGIKRAPKSGKPVPGYLTPFKKMPLQLCTGKEFREKIAGGKSASIVEKNYKTYGIPQGAPISDLLANLYLIDFDREILSAIEGLGGMYYRYSDDILIIVPGGVDKGRFFLDLARSLIKKFGAHLEIKKEKSAIVAYARDGDAQRCELIDGTQGRNGLEYLGFRFDGRFAYLRDSTISNLNRKVTRAAQRDAFVCARRYPDKNIVQLEALFDFNKLCKRFGRVENFGEKHKDYRSWTFWTYARRAAQVFGPLGSPILRQLRKHRTFVRKQAMKSLQKAVARREG